MMKSEEMLDVSHEVLLECRGVPPLSMYAEAREARRRGDGCALPKLHEMIPISHSSFGIISLFVIRHSSFL